MPANEFEKQVQHQLKEFQLNPSASVWKKVEEQIREKKRRRIIFFIILPVALGLLGFSFFQLMRTGKTADTVQQPVAIKKESPLPAEQNSNSAAETNTRSTAGEDRSTAVKPAEADRKDIAVNRDIIQDKKLVDGLNTISGISPVNYPGNNKNENKPVKNTGKSGGLKRQDDNSLVITVDPASVKQVSTAAGQSSMAAQQKEVAAKNDTGEKEIRNEETVSTDKDIDIASLKTGNAEMTDSAIAGNKKAGTAIRVANKTKIKWGIDLSGGLAFNNNGILLFPSTRAVADMNYNPGSTAGGPPVVITPPSPVRSGPAFRIGLLGELQVSKRSRFSAGLEYAYSSNRIKVGSGTDTSFTLQSNSNGFSSAVRVEQLYSGAQKNNYTNSYHFIRLPLSWHWQINKGKKLPVQWNAGMSVGYMIKTNALVYSGALGGIYYEDKNAFNKMHVDLNTGFSLRLKANNNSEWVIGPEFSFGMSRLLKNDNRQYLMFGGINAKFLLPKKKNK